MNIPKELKDLKQWCVWEKVSRDGKTTKVPKQTDGKPASANDQNTWTTYERAIGSVIRFDGIGFFFSKNDPFCGIDIDGCIRDGKLTNEANKLLKCFMSYSERSPSGTGVHVIIKADKPGDRCKFRDLPGMKEMEIYNRDRFFTITSNHIIGTPIQIEDRQIVLNTIYERALARQKSQITTNVESAGESPHLNDEEVINRLENAKNSDKFMRLYYGADFAEYNYDQSRADEALCRLIAFYTQDVEQIERIMRLSVLVRDKWDSHRTYMERTINRVLSTQEVVYKGQNKKPREL